MSSPRSSPPLRERWIAWRNRCFGSPAFQRFAARFPLTRPVAQAKARALFDLVAGFTYSQILAAAVALGLFERLARAPATAAVLAGEWAMSEPAADRLLRAAAALRLVESLPDGRWALGVDGAALLGNGGIVEMIAHHRLLYADLADPVALLRRGGGGGALQAYWHYARDTGQGDASAVAEYSALMAASQPLVVEHVLAAYRFARHRRMLDVGGGEGVFARAVARAAPGLVLGLFDLPAVVARAGGAMAAAGLAGRVALHGGDFVAGPLPAGYDLITLVRVLHDHDDATAERLLANIRTALPPRGRLLIAEPMAETPGGERAGDAYFGLYLWAMGSGQPRSAARIGAMLQRAGFRRIRERPSALPINVRVLTADIP